MTRDGLADERLRAIFSVHGDAASGSPMPADVDRRIRGEMRTAFVTGDSTAAGGDPDLGELIEIDEIAPRHRRMQTALFAAAAAAVVAIVAVGVVVQRSPHVDVSTRIERGPDQPIPPFLSVCNDFVAAVTFGDEPWTVRGSGEVPLAAAEQEAALEQLEILRNHPNAASAGEAIERAIAVAAGQGVTIGEMQDVLATVSIELKASTGSSCIRSG